MGKAIDLLYDSMTGLISRSQVKCHACPTETEYVFLSNRINKALSISFPNRSSWSNDYISNVNGWINRKVNDTEDDLVGYFCIECNSRLDASSFLMAYRFIMKYDNQNTLYKWIKDGVTYYIGKNIILDGNRSVMMMCGMDPFGKAVINIDTRCAKNENYMSKVILNEFMPAYVKAKNAIVIINNMRDFSTSVEEYEMRYGNCRTIDVMLNEKLHELSRMSFI